jgi:hypothetical protein
MSVSQGNQAATLVRVSSGNDPQSGKFIQKYWRGTFDAINAVEAELIPQNVYYTKDPEGGDVWGLTARFSSVTEEGTEEVPVSEERLRFNFVQKSIYLHPDFAGLGSEKIQAVRSAVDSGAETLFIDIVQDTLYNLVLNGVDSWTIYQPTVIVTDTASAGFAWNIGFDDYGMIFSTVNMIADADLNSGWANNLPTGGTPPSGFIYGWLKKPPEIVTVAGNKTQLVQEYEFGLWSDVLYDQA